MKYKHWKTNIDDVKIVCKKDNYEMIQESSMNLVQAIYVCPKCKEHINLGIYDFIPNIKRGFGLNEKEFEED